ncbi:MAG TPA: TMEM175 family protein [Longimicrobiales bacterium]|nr:TMEM175 family protein [Longimicrobiales bacterium]
MRNVKWRGGQVTRIEALTDAVFGFAITFLFVSFDVPSDFDALMVQLRGFVPFAACFALLILVWMYHYKLFGRFDLDDGMTLFLNSILLFVVLFYIFPLKFVFTSLLGRAATFSNWEQVRSMMTLYALGFMAVFLVFGLMYFHAIRRRESLNLSEDDVFYAAEHVAECGVMVLMGLISIVLAQTLPFAVAAPAAGFVYMFIAPLQWWRSVWMNKKRPQILLRVLT